MNRLGAPVSDRVLSSAGKIKASLRNLLKKGDPGLVVFMHIPKTAGTTVRRCIELNYKDSAITLFYPPNHKAQDADPAATRILVGHVPFGYHEKLGFDRARYFTFIRDPLKRVLSQVNHTQTYNPHNLPGLDRGGVEAAILATRIWFFDNVMVRQFAGLRDQIPFGELDGDTLELAKRNARSHFLLIGEQERFVADFTALRAKMRWKNAEPSDKCNVGDYGGYDFTDADRRYLEALNRLDRELYEYLVRELTCQND